MRRIEMALKRKGDSCVANGSANYPGSSGDVILAWIHMAAMRMKRTRHIWDTRKGENPC